MALPKLIICTGDSYTAGTELCADELIPDYSKNLSHRYEKEPRPQFLKDLNNKHVALREGLSSKEKANYLDRCKDKAWPKKLATLLDAQVINHSAGGRSNHHLLQNAISEVERQLYYKFFKPEEIEVFCMLTTSERFGYKDSKSKDISQYTTFHPSHDTSVLEAENRNYLKYVVNNYTYWDFLWSSFSEILAAQAYLKSLGVKIRFLESALWGWSIKQAQWENRDNPMFGRQDKIKKIIEIEAHMNDAVQDDICVLPGGHYIESVHDNFANLLFKRFYNDAV